MSVFPRLVVRALDSAFAGGMFQNSEGVMLKWDVTTGLSSVKDCQKRLNWSSGKLV